TRTSTASGASTTVSSAGGHQLYVSPQSPPSTSRPSPPWPSIEKVPSAGSTASVTRPLRTTGPAGPVALVPSGSSTVTGAIAGVSPACQARQPKPGTSATGASTVTRGAVRTFNRRGPAVRRAS